MKLKYIFSALILSSGVALAATQILQPVKPGGKQDGEKVKLGQSYYEGLQRVEQSVYPLMSLDGAPDGIPYGLRCDEVNDRIVRLSWNTPEAVDGYFDDFEGHDDFAVNSPGQVGWSYIDGDNKNTYSWSACTFKNQGKKMAFIVMNPSQTTPSVEANPKYVPASGKKMLATMCSIDAPNNDWIISPRLSFSEDFTFSFHAKSYRTDGITPERIRVGYSTSGKTQSSFKFITPEPYLELPDTWDLYSYTIPKEATYVCINCVSDDAFMLLLDDIMIATNEVRPNVMPSPDAPLQVETYPGKMKAPAKRLTGFNVYRDGVKVNKQPVTEVRYTDEVDTYAEHVYAISALYSDGTESALSQSITVDVVDPRLLPFEDDFDDWTLHSEKWSTPDNPAGVGSFWNIDYYTYGLVDPAATYGYSNLHNYDQSLVSRELRTLDRNTTYLRFDLRLCNWGQYENEVSYLAVEITSDDGKTWTTIDTFDNTKGEFNWTTKQYALKDYLKSDNFRLRWRAYGVYALHIDYWYVDDVKVWNPVWGALKMQVSSADGALAGAAVSLKGDKGGEHNLVTDANGNVALGQIEADTYAVQISKDGYNTFSGSVEVQEGQTASPSFHVTRPVLELSKTSVQPDLAVEGKATESFVVKNTGDGPLTWRLNYAPAKQSGRPIGFEVNRTWQGSGDVQTSIAFDGEYYYTTSWYYLGEFWKYDRQGNLVEQFRIPDMYYKLYDLAYDGRYFYGSDYSNRLFQLDFENKRIVNIIEITNAPDLEITHVAYNPNNDRFYVGGWNTLCEVRRNGRASSMAVAFDESQGHSIYGSAFDNVTEGGPYLWLSALEGYNEYMLDNVVIYQYDLNKKKFTGVKKAVTDLPGYKVGTAATGVNNICGLEGTSDLVSGRFTLVGVLQQSPSLFFEYNVTEADTWLDYSPKKSTLAPGQSATVTVNLDARDGQVGKAVSNKITVNTIPELKAQTVTLGYQATKASATPRPLSLTATNQVAANVELAWVQPAVAPDSYTVYCNGKPLATGVKATSFTHTNVVRGSYTYEVTAVYGTSESVRSDAAQLFVQQGAPFFAPLELNSALALNKNVSLSWKSPLAYAQQSTTLTWGTGEHADQCGLADGGTFYVASFWSAEDIVNHRGKQITSASVRIVNPLTYLAACIFKDGKLVVRQQYEANVAYGEWNTVRFKTPVEIEAGSDYIVAFQLEHAAGLQPVGLDASKEVDGKGNMLSDDGEYWFPATQMAIEGNICLKFDVQAKATAEAAPTGYNVYRNGTKVNSSPLAATSFSESLAQAGLYQYTVTSVYPAGESQASNASQVKVIPIANRLAPNQLLSAIECNREVALHWGFPIQGQSTFPIDIQSPVTTSEALYPTYVQSFMGQGSEMAIASDCRFIYTSSHNEDGRVNKYDLNGHLLDHFYIKGLDAIRNITFDGHDFWVSTVNTNIYKVDMDAHTILETHPISEYARHLTYIPDLDGGKGGFEVGDWNTSIYTNAIGSKIGTGPVLHGACGTAYHDGRLYAFEQGGTNAYTIGIYDLQTCQRIGEINLGHYVGLNKIESASAGGMSVIRTPEGLVILAICIQNTMDVNQFLFLELGGISGLSGYNVYRNGTKVNKQLLTQRSFAETLTEEGNYDYQVETVYIDGTVSAKSAAERVVIVPAGTADAPIALRAEPTTYGYNVAVSYADPALPTSAALFQSFEDQTVDKAVSVAGWTAGENAWQVASRAYHGDKALYAAHDVEASLILPANDNRWFGLFAKNEDDHHGSGNVQILASEDDVLENFILVDEFATSELWSACEVELPAGTRYVMVRKPAGSPAAFVDAFRLNPAAPASTVWGYDIFRDGKQINAQSVRGISYMDHNLTPGTYTYQVRQRSVTAALSPFSQAVTLNLQYSNGGQAPENFRVTSFHGNRAQLEWQAPALGDALYLKWHSGNSSDAAGLPSGGSFYAGVRWLASDLKDYGYLRLSEVEVYVNQIPDALYLLVYQGNNLVGTQYVRDLKQYAFNRIQLEHPVQVDPTRDLRVVVYVEHNEITVPLGYDEGPAVSGRGNIYSSDGITWTTMDNDESGITGNWNISIGLRPFAQDETARRAKSAFVEDEGMPFARYVDFDAQEARAAAPRKAVARAQSLTSVAAGVRKSSSLNTFNGYNVYANNAKLNDSPIRATSYTDTNDYTPYPFVQYKAAAVYEQLGEVFTPTVTINVTGVESLYSSKVRVGCKEGRLNIAGATAGDAVKVFDANGRLVYETVAPGASLFTLPVTLPAGVYVVSVGTYSCKGTVSK